MRLRDTLADVVKMPVAVVNDVDAQAMGAIEDASPASFFVISVGTAVGGAYVAEGVLQRGRTSVAEIGHIPVGTTGAVCPCGGTDCLDLALGGRMLEARLGQRWWERESNEVEQEIRAAGIALANAVRTVTALYEVDFVLCVGSLFERTGLWTAFEETRVGLNADVPIRVIPDSWVLAARGLARSVRLGQSESSHA
jgi:predicted NBD/HSP70 family sugar kinase